MFGYLTWEINGVNIHDDKLERLGLLQDIGRSFSWYLAFQRFQPSSLVAHINSMELQSQPSHFSFN